MSEHSLGNLVMKIFKFSFNYQHNYLFAHEIMLSHCRKEIFLLNTKHVES